MKRYFSLVALLVIAGLLPCIQHHQAIEAAPENTAGWEVYFSPNGGCTKAIVATVAGAKKTVLVQAYSFTSAPIAAAIVDAKKRGVAVQVILDKSQQTARYTAADDLRRAGVPTFIDAAHAIAHNKIIIIDGQTVITGSFNFSKAAEESNAENLVILQSADLAARYTSNWKAHLAHTQAYTGRQAAD